MSASLGVGWLLLLLLLLLPLWAVGTSVRLASAEFAPCWRLLRRARVQIFDLQRIDSRMG